MSISKQIMALGPGESILFKRGDFLDVMEVRAEDAYGKRSYQIIDPQEMSEETLGALAKYVREDLKR